MADNNPNKSPISLSFPPPPCWIFGRHHELPLGSILPDPAPHRTVSTTKIVPVIAIAKNRDRFHVFNVLFLYCDNKQCRLLVNEKVSYPDWNCH
eukprot:scaffold1648_cov115-Cylindrotheca_fusiformis.AAC.2